MFQSRSNHLGYWLLAIRVALAIGYFMRGTNRHASAVDRSGLRPALGAKLDKRSAVPSQIHRLIRTETVATRDRSIRPLVVVLDRDETPDGAPSGVKSVRNVRVDFPRPELRSPPPQRNVTSC